MSDFEPGRVNDDNPQAWYVGIDKSEPWLPKPKKVFEPVTIVIRSQKEADDHVRMIIKCLAEAGLKVVPK